MSAKRPLMVGFLPKKKYCRYSGPNSSGFWRRVGGLPRGDAHSSLYTAGVLLQEMELRVLGLLEQYEAGAPKPSRKVAGRGKR